MIEDPQKVEQPVRTVFDVLSLGLFGATLVEILPIMTALVTLLWMTFRLFETYWMRMFIKYLCRRFRKK